MVNLPFRQIHLDFHTSPDIPDVGAEFNADEFAQTLKDAHVSSVTVFARGHHGLCYYDTKVGPKHPALTFDLLGEQVAACHARGIRTPAYVTVSWDEWSARNHPEWAARNRDGTMWLGGPLRATWHGVCMFNDAYQKYLLAITEEVLRHYEVDGLFMDIWMGPHPTCYCWSCLDKMHRAGVDAEHDEACRLFNDRMCEELMVKVRTLADGIRPGASVFFNSCLRVGKSDWLKHFTHIEIESLPTGGWGYAHFPLFQRYFRNFGQQTMGMTARFHRTWGDFGGLKNAAALEFECFSMLASGARCSVGDQLHPRGRLEPAVYELIGGVYESVEHKEPWCVDAEHVAQLAVIHADGQEESQAGAVRMLLEEHELFDIVDADGDFTPYDVLLLPDGVRVDEALADKLRHFLKEDGALLLSGESGLRQNADEFALDEMGLSYVGPADYDPNFLCKPASQLEAYVANFHYMMYRGGHYVKPASGTHVLASIGVPYFNRTWAHYCSHGPTPFDRPSDHPAVVQNGRILYFAHPIFRLYAEQGAQVYRKLVAGALGLLRSRKIVRGNLPSTARVDLQRQSAHDRLVLHVLNYVAERRTRDLDVIEEAQPIVHADLSVYTGTQPTKVYSAPDRTQLDFHFKDECTAVRVPCIRGHAMIVFEGLKST